MLLKFFIVFCWEVVTESKYILRIAEIMTSLTKVAKPGKTAKRFLMRVRNENRLDLFCSLLSDRYLVILF